MRYFLPENKVHDGEIWPKCKLFLAYCLQIRAIFKKIWQKGRFAPIDSSAEEGPALLFAICRENDDAMHTKTGISRPAYSVYGICGSRNSRRIGRRATDLKNGNAGPKLHWSLWENAVFRPSHLAGTIHEKLIPLFDFLGPKQNFFSLTVCS